MAEVAVVLTEQEGSAAAGRARSNSISKRTGSNSKPIQVSLINDLTFNWYMIYQYYFKIGRGIKEPAVATVNLLR